MRKHKKTLNSPALSETVVDGHAVSGRKSNGRFSRLTNISKKKLAFVMLFVVVGVVGVFFANAATTTSSLWSASDIPKTITDPDSQAVELGVKFQSKYAGKVTAVKFYKGAQNTGTHTGSLWDMQGNRLATVTFKNETASGWQTANFPQAVNIAANVTYIVSYHAPNGHYSGDNDYFNSARVKGSLTAPKSEPGSANGIYAYSSTSTFPSQTYRASNYWVDVVVQTELIAPPVASAPPTKVTAVQNGSSIVVNWNTGYSSNGITKYRIYKNNAYLKAVGGKELSFVDTAVTPGKTYTYQIKTVDANDVGSVRSVAASVTYSVTPPPACPTGQTGTPPNCVTPTPASCPTGQTGTPPNCVTPPVSTGGLPTADNTGYKHTGVTLKSCEQYASGSSYIIRGTAAGTVVDGCDFLNKQVRIEGGGSVTLKRSRVRNASNCDAACAAVLVAKGAGPVVIEDVEITTTNPSVTNEEQRQDRSIGIFKGNTQPVVIRRVYAHDTTRGADITGQNNITFVDSYMAYNVSPPTNGNCGQERKHSSAVRAAGGVYNVVFKNTVLGIGNCSFASGILAFYPENGANHDITIDGGMWIIQGNNSGGYGIAAGYTKPQPNAKPPIKGEKQNYNFTVKNLQISTQYNASGCPSGCAQNWNQEGDPATNGIGPLGGTKVWQNVTKYNPGKADHGKPVNP